jgi:hypothetical protein
MIQNGWVPVASRGKHPKFRREVQGGLNQVGQFNK